VLIVLLFVCLFVLIFLFCFKQCTSLNAVGDGGAILWGPVSQLASLSVTGPTRVSVFTGNNNYYDYVQK
jgi:hypothetical protein